MTFCHRNAQLVVTSNPYSPPTSEPSTSLADAPTKRLRRGPALYIVGFGLLGGLGAIPILAMRSMMGFAVVLLGCMSGGIVYRLRSRRWPHDPSIPQRQIFYSTLAILIPPGVLFFLAGTRGQGPGIIVIGVIVGVSVACGIFISGTRRLNASQEEAELAVE